MTAVPERVQWPISKSTGLSMVRHLPPAATMRLYPIVLVLLCSCDGCFLVSHPCNAPAAEQAGPLSPPLDCANSWDTAAKPFFSKYCSQCHFWDAASFPANGPQIRSVVFGCGMPPRDEPQPTVEDLQKLSAWLDCGACSNETSNCSSDASCATGQCECGSCCIPAQANCARNADDGGAVGCCAPMGCFGSLDGGSRCCSLTTCNTSNDCCNGQCVNNQCSCLSSGNGCFNNSDCCSDHCSRSTGAGSSDGGFCD